jgi:TetR/AcrR family transcriptional regulator, mexCD-oprJ operon repressor
VAIVRDEVLMAAAKVLVGEPQASMAQVAAGARISRASLCRLVSSRDALLLELTELGVQRGIEAIGQARVDEGDPRDAVCRVIDGLLPFVDLFVLASRTHSSTELFARTEEMDLKLTELFLRGQRSGVFRVELSAGWMTESLYALLTSAVLAAHGGRLAPREIAQVTYRTLLGGIVDVRDAA